MEYYPAIAIAVSLIALVGALVSAWTEVDFLVVFKSTPLREYKGRNQKIKEIKSLVEKLDFEAAYQESLHLQGEVGVLRRNIDAVYIANILQWVLAYLVIPGEERELVLAIGVVSSFLMQFAMFKFALLQNWVRYQCREHILDLLTRAKEIEIELVRARVLDETERSISAQLIRRKHLRDSLAAATTNEYTPSEEDIARGPEFVERKTEFQRRMQIKLADRRKEERMSKQHTK